MSFDEEKKEEKGRTVDAKDDFTLGMSLQLLIPRIRRLSHNSNVVPGGFGEIQRREARDGLFEVGESRHRTAGGGSTGGG
jgi:hypothetical protein